jgi:uncharacterized Zn finger protein
MGWRNDKESSQSACNCMDNACKHVAARLLSQSEVKRSKQREHYACRRGVPQYPRLLLPCRTHL